MKIGLPIDMNQICPTIKATYYKVSAANMVNSAHYPHGGVLVIKSVKSVPHTLNAEVYTQRTGLHLPCVPVLTDMQTTTFAPLEDSIND